MSGSSVRGRPLPDLATLLALAQLTKDTHEQVAATMDGLAKRGGPHAERRRMLAGRARRFAEFEAQHISHWTARQSAQPGS